MRSLGRIRKNTQSPVPVRAGALRKGNAMTDVSAIAAAHGFELTGSREMPDIEGAAHVMTHAASGARLLYLENDDANKAFSITFKTPPMTRASSTSWSTRCCAGRRSSP